MGSGPYVIAEVKPGETIAYARNPDSGARTSPSPRACGISTTVRFDYFRDSNAAFEAFKKGQAEVRIETDPVRWSTGYDFPAVTEEGRGRKNCEQRSPAPAGGFAFNTRREIFKDTRVREALVHGFRFRMGQRQPVFDNVYSAPMAIIRVRNCPQRTCQRSGRKWPHRRSAKLARRS